MFELRLTGGVDKLGRRENIQSFSFKSGNVYTIIGKTGSGKSQLINDIESVVNGEGITQRRIVLPKQLCGMEIAELSQNMQFILDLTVGEFIEIRNQLLSSMIKDKFLRLANELCGEEICMDDKLTRLSGGQSRAVMITDIALNANSKVVLIDEIENAGIDKVKAVNLLMSKEKIVIIVTHDPLLGLFGCQRLIMKDGGISEVVHRTRYEEKLIDKLYNEHKRNEALRTLLRSGNEIKEKDYAI